MPRLMQVGTLTGGELKQAPTYVLLRRHPKRNRSMLLMTQWTGMRRPMTEAALVQPDKVKSITASKGK
jgi:hypothetical protein